MSKTYRQCNGMMGKIRDQVYRAYDKGYEQGKIDYQRLPGTWEKQALGIQGVWFKCSNCYKLAIADYAFCPQCGSDMRGDAE